MTTRDIRAARERLEERTHALAACRSARKSALRSFDHEEEKALGVPEPKPEPTRPALWEWVRAACESRLGEPRMHTLRGGALQWALPHTVIWALRDDRADGGVWHVQRDSGETIAATCHTPAELTAALNALAEEVGK